MPRLQAMAINRGVISRTQKKVRGPMLKLYELLRLNRVMNELELYAWLKWHLLEDLKRSDFEYETYDCVSESKGIYLELKCRKTHYDKLIIEKVKFDAIRQKAWEYGYKAWYVNSTPKGIWAFNITDIEGLEWFTRELPKTTEFNNTENVEKIVGYLNINRGVQLNATRHEVQ